MADTTDNILLEVKDLKLYFPIYRGLFQRLVGHVKAVDGISFSVKEREVLGLVGESGCGKTTAGRTILRLYDPTAGEIHYRDKNGRVGGYCPHQPARYEAAAPRDAHDLSGPVQLAQPALDGQGHHQRAVGDPRRGARQGGGAARRGVDASLSA